MNSKFDYLLVTNDKYELPIMIECSLHKLAKASGYDVNVIKQAYYRNGVVDGCYRVRAVDIREPKDKFNLCEYKEFCKDNGLPLGNFSSIQKFAQECFELCEGF